MKLRIMKCIQKDGKEFFKIQEKSEGFFCFWAFLVLGTLWLDYSDKEYSTLQSATDMMELIALGYRLEQEAINNKQIVKTVPMDTLTVKVG
jgi:hypothetical protein